ncbi:MAG: hypothetical protein CM15mV60_500 [uncultured marine virus]|nr:MAG: hypothetical protein CM15mV60_500 [uncultured marine virus]
MVMIYNTTTDGGSNTTTLFVYRFGSDKKATNGTFEIRFPANDSSNAIISCIRGPCPTFLLDGAD